MADRYSLISLLCMPIFVSLSSAFILSFAISSCKPVSAKILEALGSKSPVEVLVTRDFVMENLDLMAKLESLGAEIQFFDEKDDSLDQLAGFGGILLKLA